ncbi:hypothetical protein CCACVL1_20101 [Corchorus capsularis]|uniref:Uncharacterized protein n=1 Tax=Corchorus capsularis TaxID=210143 RepID=A0A1R3HCI5_COCAP|nr:hypothetical protein CCACVL1_20101 [Corchorus capsularis]
MAGIGGTTVRTIGQHHKPASVLMGWQVTSFSSV